MPELPEVETIVRSLRPMITGKKVVGVDVRYAPIIGYPAAETFANKLVGKKIEEIRRRGKYIVMEVTGGELLITHLKMSGRLIYVPQETKVEKHTHVIISLNDNHELRFIEVRKFGRMFLIPENQLEKAGGFATLGPEPLKMTMDEFKAGLKNRKGKIKSLLLNQEFIAGVGNIYADEALFLSKIHPERTVDTLSEEEKELLFSAIQQVLNIGIENRGTTKRDYVDAFGQAGKNQNYLKVYGREGEKCYTCGTEILRIKVGGRSSHYCPNCQPPK
ncbi:DNA-formamidopyrimidine glycosylase [Anoxybacter fermentans]|uniref:Formamidopyrimidine-DNA glycosylase n=1 Tax=Anoxybacter fermentans TaxID=1323375 RepID=A0A3Q9HR37_9FIRM|nr:bifunctional DNA-formamidopyrimidine glycosylase/DNA-(apurinic or apyrimidinic site) lyase [Anoxybacter fermentans]AZR73722.1 DNA-formamidopyrimidine glycosylase [Anoxybacter fermentans]